MSDLSKSIEKFFLESLLKICLASILIVSAVDFYFTRFEVTRSVIVDSAILFAVITAFVLYKYHFFRLSVIWIALIITAAMFYQSIMSDSITTSSMAVIMVVGFGYSVLLEEKMATLLHVLTLLGMISIFSWLGSHPLLYGKPDATDIIVAGVTYIILYIVIAYSTRILKNRYDDMVRSLADKNRELFEKAQEIETQNEELVQSQENLYQVNIHLETLVEARTMEVKKQNEQLIKYAYSNAHHVRGPVARVLGLIQLSKIDSGLDLPFLFEQIEKQTQEIDQVVKDINKELEL